ncbi:MAG: alpha/beta hydrolase [Acidimicrobiales bacterium]
MPVDPQAQALLDQFAGFGLKNLSDLPLDQLRGLIVELSSQAPRDEVAEVRDLVVDEGDVPIRLYRPAGSSPSDVLGVLVWFHGGGWTIGNVEASDSTCRSLANRSGAAVVSVDYRMGPEHRFPAAVDDCWAATCWVASHAAELGIDPRRIAVGGDSAGGNLAAVVSLLARDAGGPAIRHQALVYPAVDLRMTFPSIDENAEGYLLTKGDMVWFLDQYHGDNTDAVNDWRLSPMLAASHDHLPPATIITAGYDPLRDEGGAYGELLRAGGAKVHHVHYPSMIHGFFGMVGQIDAAEVAQDEVAGQLRLALA